jgi:hypothetical protein
MPSDVEPNPSGIGPGFVPQTSGWIARAIPFFVLAIGVAISSYIFVAPGHPLTVDTWPHLSRTKMVYEALLDGHSPFWSFMFYSGYPALRFYSPLFYFAAGVLALATRGNILLAVRILLLALQVLSVCAMFLFLWRRTRDVQAVSLGSLIYTIVPWRAYLVGAYAHYPQAIIYVTLPLMFLFLDRLMARPNRRDALLLGLVVALGLLSHVIYGVAAVVFLGLVLVLGYAQSALQTGKTRFSSFVVTAALTTLGLTASFVVPFLAEYQSHVFLRPLPSVVTLDPREILGLLPRTNGHYGGYLGLSVLALLLLAMATKGPARQRRYALAMKLCVVVVLLYVFALPLSGAVGAKLAANLPLERFLVFFLFFAAFLIGTAWPVWKARAGRVGRFSLFAFVALAEIITLDCAGRNLLHYYYPKQQFLAARPDVYSLIAEEGDAKILDLTVLRDRVDDFMRTEAYPAMGFVFGNLATPLGSFYHQFAPKSMFYCYPWINAVAADLGDASTAAVAVRCRKALALMGVSYVLMYPKVLQCSPSEYPIGPRLLMKEGLRWDDRFVKPGKRPYLVFGSTGFGPVLASNRVRPVPAESTFREGVARIAEDWKDVLDSITLDDTLAELSYIPITEQDRPESLPSRPRLEVAEASIRNQDVTVKLTTSCECFLRLAVSYYPELRVTVGGTAVQFRETKDHFIYLRCPAGAHEVRVTAPLTPIRRWTAAVSGIAAILVLLGLILP